ncbi:MAG: DUF4349 domain-containing protein [Candidatus Acidiferrales bacterium]
MRSTHPFEQEEVMAYLDGEITAGRATEIALHLQRCAECRALAASFHDLSYQLAAWEIESSPARLTEQMNLEIADADARPKPAETTPLQRFSGLLSALKTRPWVWAGAGALAVLALMLVGRPNTFSGNPAALVASRDGALAPGSAAGGGSGEGKGIVGGAVQQSRREELQALQKRMAQDEVASSLENNPPNGRSITTFTQLQPGLVESSPQSTPPTGMPSSPLIARTATLSIVVKDFGSVESAVKGVTTHHSGYIGELNTTAPPDAAKTFSATLRVPSAQLDAALAELKQLGRVEQETQAGEEVTKQYTDLAARLKNSRATEQRLLDVLRHNTGKVKDVLEVENEISRVRGEIEEMEADQRALQSRIDFATITLSVTEEYKASLNDAPSSTGTRLHNAFVAGCHSVVENMIGLLAWLLEAGPTLLLWAALLFFPVRWAWKRLHRAIAAKALVAS